ncbi:tyrosine-type recombinase/integrase, partial [Streptomyces sp. NPDC005055]
MFTCENGEPFHAADVTWWFIQLYEEIGLPPVRLHDLRHGAATPAHAAGTDLKDIQEMLGHSSITITADTYTSLLPEADLAPKAWRPVRSRTAHASGPGRGVRGRIERLPVLQGSFESSSSSLFVVDASGDCLVGATPQGLG